jgi:hypothetical protein
MQIKGVAKRAVKAVGNVIKNKLGLNLKIDTSNDGAQPAALCQPLSRAPGCVMCQYIVERTEKAVTEAGESRLPVPGTYADCAPGRRPLCQLRHPDHDRGGRGDPPDP